MRVVAHAAGDREMLRRVFLYVVGFDVPRVQDLLSAVTLLALSASGRCRHHFRVSGAAPLFHERMMDAVVAFAAAIGQTRVDAQWGERLDGVGILDVW